MPPNSTTMPIINVVMFEPDGSAVVQYVLPNEDVKANGVMVQHTVHIPSGEDYDDEIEAVTTTAIYMLLDVLDDLPRLPAMPRTPAPDKLSVNDDDDDEDDDFDAERRALRESVLRRAE